MPGIVTQLARFTPINLALNARDACAGLCMEVGVDRGALNIGVAKLFAGMNEPAASVPVKQDVILSLVPMRLCSHTRIMPGFTGRCDLIQQARAPGG